MAIDTTRRSLAGLPLAFAAVTASASGAAAAPNGKLAAEVAAFRAFILAQHPEGPRAQLDAAWMRQGDALARAADGMDPAKYLVEVLSLLSWFKDGHTLAFPFAYGRGGFQYGLPVQALAFSDGLYVTDAQDEAAELKGCRVTHLARRPIAEVMARMAQVWPGDNPATVQSWAFVLLQSPAMLRGLGLASGPEDAPVSIGVTTPDGRAREMSLKPRQTGLRFPHLREPANQVGTLNGGRCVLATLDAFEDVGRPFKAFREELFAAIEAPEVTRLIFDLRRNPGGNNFHGDRIRHHLQRSRLNRPGGFYLLIGPRTFSAAQNFVTRMERETFVTLVGEPTGGRPNHFGDARLFAAPESGMTVRVSTLRWQDMPPLDQRRWTMPDLLVPSTYADHAAGRDPVLDAALAHQADAAALDERALLQPWERDSQKRDWKPFWE